ncbi:hypothetical protein [Phenylobacterium aquaticum]|uniref:hypothetical protein n=1 Tax=Phenylobacterium aquaticum TaxID=1763816 RepID=UPI001F5CA4ED|nr:hypothetical protein [Phenylobacterium aquaticum]MCI3132309.1 hypothetical protein [Phenylobacterium aquaticum]
MGGVRRFWRLVAAMAALFAAPGLALAAPHLPAKPEGALKGVYVPVETPPKTAEIVKVGFYPQSVYQLDMASNTYYVDTYVWLRWTGAIDPTGTIEFTNMGDEWGKQQEAILPEPETLKDGSKYQIFRIEGRFVQPFSLADYPLDRQHLSILVEDTTNSSDALAYVIDRADSGMGRTLQVPGWKLNGWTAETFRHDYGSALGEGGAATAYSGARFSIDITRPLSFFYWKLLLPLFIVLVAALSALMIGPLELEVRTALPAGALLTAVFLQKSYSDGLPDLGYLILMDKIYLVAYALILLTLIRVIVANPRGADEAQAIAVQKADRRLLAAMLATFAASTALLIGLR